MKTLFAIAMMGVGQLMGPQSGTGGAPPTPTYRIITEGGDVLTTEGNDALVTESAP